MALGFAVAAAKFGAPIAKFLLKHYLGEGTAAVGGGLIDIAAQRVMDEEAQRLAVRQFEDIGDKIVRRVLPLFSDLSDSSAEAVAHDIGLTLAGQISAEFFLEKDLDPAKLGAALRSARPLPSGMFSAAETALYDRALDETVRYIVGVAQSLPRFEPQAVAATLGRLSRIGRDLEKVLDGIAKIERLVEQLDPTETSRRYECDYRQAVQRNLDYLELFGADISPEAQRHSLSVGYVSLNFASASQSEAAAPTTHSADDLLWLLGAGKGRLLLRGHAGSGKSTLARWLAIQAASGESLSGMAWQRLLISSPHIFTMGAGAAALGNISLAQLSKLNIGNLGNALVTLQDPLGHTVNWAATNIKSVMQHSYMIKAFQLRGNIQTAQLSAATSSKRQLATNNLTVEIPAWWQVDHIPFLVRLRDCRDARLPGPDNLPELIAKELGRPPAEWVRSVLDGGRGLLLFDGVDEVPNHRRDAIRQDLEAIIRRYPNNHFVVTTRPTAVPERWLASVNFDEASLNPMDQRDQAGFIRRWHAAVGDELARQGRPADVSSLADELIIKLSENPPIARLATNPLLCAALCALHRDRHRKLPESQSELCEALCHMLLHRRETQAGLDLAEFPREYRNLTYEQKRAIVQEIAHYMVRNDDSVIAEEDALEKTAGALAGFPNGRREEAPAVLKALVERSGVLREEHPGVIDFIHNTIKEFLAAEMFVVARDVSSLARRAVDDAWRQVVLFASATRDREFATRLARKIIDFADGENDTDRARRLRLAAVGCRYAALHMEPEMVAKLADIEQGLVPPRSMVDAEGLAASGDNVVSLLKYRRMRAREAAACVRTLRLVGTEAAKSVLEGYVGDMRQVVVAELGHAVNPLRLKAVRERLVRGESIPLGLERYIPDLSPLAALSETEAGQIQDLNLSGAPIADCAPLRILIGLRSLNLRGTRAASLADLASLVNLEVLDVSGTDVADLEPLSELRRLRYLDVSDSKVSDIGPLRELTGLTHIVLRALELQDFQPLAQLPNLHFLDVSNTRFSDLGLIAHCSELIHLAVDSTPIRELGPIAAFTKLQFLDVSNTRFSDLGLIAHCSELTRLQLAGTPIRELDPIVALTKLQFLDICPTSISDLRPLAKLPELKTLFLADLTEATARVLLELPQLRTVLVLGTTEADAEQALQQKGVSVL